MADDSLFSTLPPELDEKIAIHLSRRDILALCSTESKLSDICSDVSFWKRKIRQDFPNVTEEEITRYFNLEDPPHITFLKLLTDKGGVEIGSERFISPLESGIRAAKIGDESLINYFTSLGANKYWIMMGLWVNGYKDFAIRFKNKHELFEKIAEDYDGEEIPTINFHETELYRLTKLAIIMYLHRLNAFPQMYEETPTPTHGNMQLALYSPRFLDQDVLELPQELTKFAYVWLDRFNGVRTALFEMLFDAISRIEIEIEEWELYG